MTYKPTHQCCILQIFFLDLGIPSNLSYEIYNTTFLQWILDGSREHEQDKGVDALEDTNVLLLTKLPVR